jgi:hypothetical protein
MQWSLDSVVRAGRTRKFIQLHFTLRCSDHIVLQSQFAVQHSVVQTVQDSSYGKWPFMIFYRLHGYFSALWGVVFIIFALWIPEYGGNVNEQVLGAFLEGWKKTSEATSVEHSWLVVGMFGVKIPTEDRILWLVFFVFPSPSRKITGSVGLYYSKSWRSYCNINNQHLTKVLLNKPKDSNSNENMPTNQRMELDSKFSAT